MKKNFGDNLKAVWNLIMKHWTLAIPAAIIGGAVGVIQYVVNLVGSTAITSWMTGSLLSGSWAGFLGSLISSLVGSLVLGSITYLLAVVAQPMLYGMANDSINQGQTVKITVESFFKYLGRDIIKYLPYWLVVTVAFNAVAVLLGVVTLITIILPMAIALAAVIWPIFNMITYPIMLNENVSLMPALKRSFQTIGKNFWMVVGVSIVLGIGVSIASGTLSLILGWVPVLGSIVRGGIASALSLVSIFYSLVVYRDARDGV